MEQKNETYSDNVKWLWSKKYSLRRKTDLEYFIVSQDFLTNFENSDI